MMFSCDKTNSLGIYIIMEYFVNIIIINQKIYNAQAKLCTHGKGKASL